MFHGYLELNGVELVNHERFDAYIAKQMPGALGWFRDPDDNGDLQLGLGDDEYASPLVDGAPWVDPGDPASQRFYGCYWVTEGGFGDSTRTGSTVESMGAGGTVGPVRLATGQFPISLLLVAADEEAMEAGVTWLRNVLEVGCASCVSGTLQYLLDVPRESYEFDSAGSGDGVDFGILTANNSPVTFALAEMEPDSARCVWTRLYDAGITHDVQVQMWTMNDGQRESDSGEVWLQRTNWSPNPNFMVDTSSWAATTNGALSRPGGIGRFTPTVPASAWMATQTVTAKQFVRTISIDLRADVPGTVSLLADGMGAATDVQVGTVWQRFVVPLASGGTSLKISAVAGSGLGYLEMRQEMIEEGTFARPFMDASQTPPSPDYMLLWLGTPGVSPSRLSFDMTKLGGRSVIRPNTLATLYLNVLVGQLDSGMMGAGYSFASGTQWMDRVTRQVLRTKATSGPTRSQVLNTQGCGAARIYNLVLTTGKPYAFTLPAPETNVLANFDVIDDRGVIEALNLAPNPKAAVDVSHMSANFGTGAGTLTRVSTGQPSPAQFGAQMKWTSAAAANTSDLDLTGMVPWMVQRESDEDIPFGVMANITGTLRVGAQLKIVFHDSFGDPIPGLGGSFTGGAGIYTLPAAMAHQVDGVSLHLLPPAGQAVAVNDTLIVTTIQLLPNTPILPAGYFDGDTVSGFPLVRTYAWRGVPNSSASVQVLLQACPSDTPVPVVDPNCAPVPAPPRPPVVNLLCAPDDGILSWDRYYIVIPADQVASNATTVPVMSISSQAGEQRVMRVRMFANPFNYDPDQVDPCSYCGEFIISYLPEDAVLNVDGRTREATINVGGGGDQQASSLLFGTGGGPMVWPELTCGIPYVVTVDMPAGSDPGAILFNMGMVRRE